VIRKAASMMLLLALATSAWAADSLWLKDGRRLEGRILLKPDQVVLITDQKQTTFSSEEVQHIASRQSARELLHSQALPAPTGDVAGEWFRMAQWLKAFGLQSQAHDAYRQTLQHNPHHAPANREMGNVRINGRWLPLATARDRALRLLAKGRGEEVLRIYLPALKTQATTRRTRMDHCELAVAAHLQTLDFAAAYNVSQILAKEADEPRKTRYKTLAETLEQHPDGMVVLDAPWPPESALLANDEPSLQAGPASLSDPLTLQAFWHERACQCVARAGEELDQVARLLAQQSPQSQLAEEAVSRAGDLLDRAEALSAGTAEAWRYEHRTLAIRVHRLNAARQARRFDKQLQDLWNEPPNTPAYQRTIEQLLDGIGRLERELRAVATIARREPQHHNAELALARDDLLKLARLRRILHEERRRIKEKSKEVADAS
jgi:hypothetical protein